MTIDNDFNNIIFIGDIHGKFYHLNQKLKKNICQDKIIICVGDVGIGFPDNLTPQLPENFYFIRGNHDNPQICKSYKKYMGDYGAYCYSNLTMFYISGAYSIDKNYRTIGVDWWDDEELSMQSLQLCIDAYKYLKPEVVISHDCPIDIYNNLGHYNILKSRTALALQSMFEYHKPKYWIFGHHHQSKKIIKDNTLFICLNELELLSSERLKIENH
jgi:predicted phosphodiesterase